MSCEPTLDWIWECEHPDDEPPEDVAAHLDACDACQEEHRARRAVARDLRALRFALDEAPPQRTDRAVATAVGAALAEEPAAFAPPTAITTEVHHHHHPRGAVDAPRATPAFLLTAAAVLFLALGIGFAAGRTTAPDTPEHATLATLAGTDDVHKVHSVGLRRAGLDGLMSGSTYLLTGPRGGPYRVVARVSVDTPEDELVPAAGSEEIVVAVASESGWTRGSQLALHDLTDPSVSILARRSLAQR